MVKPDNQNGELLSFEFHFYKICCRMLQENKSYIMKIIFDTDEYILPLVTGQNPKFNFDQIITKQYKYEQLENTYMEIILYSLPNSLDIYSISGTKNELIKKANFYSSFRISLLTIVIGPEFHNLRLLSPYKRNEHLGRVMYVITCKQIANINIKINNVKITLDSLSNNDIALKLKYHDKKLNPNSMYTSSINPNILEKEKMVEYYYKPNIGENNPLNLNIKTSMYDLVLADSSLNFYIVRLINDGEEVNLKNSLFQKTDSELKLITNKISDEKNAKLMNHYTIMGVSILSFLEILTENDDALNKQSSQFFRHMSSYDMPTEEENNNDINNNNLQVFTIQIFLDINRLFTTPIYYEGLEIGKCEINIDIKNIPLIRQIMCGVMTENGFEINSIHLYDNLLSAEGSSLPNEITQLINQKNSFNNEMIKQKQLQSNINHEFNITILGFLRDFKKILSKTIEPDCLYFGYTENKDLYAGQNVILDLGLILIKIIDKLNKDQRSFIFEILKLINDRSEFDLGTLSSKWFKDKNGNNKNKRTYSLGHNKYVFMDETLLKNKIIENFLEFNYNCLKYSLEIINRGKLVDLKSLDFAENYLKIAYFRIPFFREILLNSISYNVTEKIEDILSQRKNSNQNAIDSDPINSLLIWEDLFYEKLNNALDENNKTNKIENEIKEKINKIKNILDVNKTIEIIMKNNSNNNTTTAKEELNSDWKVIFSQRDNLFFNLVINVVNYILSKKEASKDVNWLNIPGFDLLLNAVFHEIHSRQVKSFSPQFKQIFKLLINNPKITNALIKKAVIKTNLYDVPGIFNIIDIINSIFKEFEKRNPGENFLKFNYELLNQMDKYIFKVDHSMCVAKLILFYYNCAHIMKLFHIGEIMQNVFFGNFFELFFHWSFEVRDKFYFFILYIIGYRLKDIIPFKDREDLKYFKKTSNNEITGNNLHKSLGDILDNKLKTIKELQNIILVQNYDMNYNNIINPKKYSKILQKIPEDVQKNIVMSINHYDKVYQEYKTFMDINKNKMKFDIQYPELELILPKDD